MIAPDSPTEKRLVELRERIVHTAEDLAEIKFIEDQLRWANKEERRIAEERAGKQIVRELPVALKPAQAAPTAPVALLAAPEEEEPPYYNV